MVDDDIVIEALLDDVLDRSMVEDAINEAVRLVKDEANGAGLDDVEAELKT